MVNSLYVTNFHELLLIFSTTFLCLVDTTFTMEKYLEPILFCDIYYINVCNHVIEKNYCIIVKRVVDFFHFENEVYLNQQLLCLFLFIFIVFNSF